MKIQKNQSGLAHLMVIGIVVVIGAAIGVAAWRISASKSNDNSPKATVNKQVQSACLKQVNDANLCKFAASINLNQPYKATATTLSDSGSSTMTIASDGKNNTSLSGTSSGTAFDYITIGTSTYIKDATSGTWLKYTTDSTNSASTANPADNLKLSTNDLTAGGTITYKFVDKEACGNLKCFKYQATDTSTPGVTQYFWFDDKNYQLQRFAYSDPTTGVTDMKFTYQNVNITTPSPVQDATTSTDSSSTPSQADINAAIQAAQNAAAASGSSSSDY